MSSQQTLRQELNAMHQRISMQEQRIEMLYNEVNSLRHQTNGGSYLSYSAKPMAIGDGPVNVQNILNSRH